MHKLYISILGTASILICAGCSPHPDDPLGKAAVHGNLAELHRLLTQHPSLADCQRALVWAARFGQAEAVFVLVKNGADPNTTCGVNDWTVLMHAIHKDQPRSVLALLNNGANVNLPGGHGETPLMMAAGYGYTGIVRILLDHGANCPRDAAQWRNRTRPRYHWSRRYRSLHVGKVPERDGRHITPARS
ncbi:MAG: ankyrin repeat domain-containing protein [Bryobacteraceae bacterium]